MQLVKEEPSPAVVERMAHVTEPWLDFDDGQHFVQAVEVYQKSPLGRFPPFLHWHSNISCLQGIAQAPA